VSLHEDRGESSAGRGIAPHQEAHGWLLAGVALAVLACSLAIPVSAVVRGVVRIGAVTIPASREQHQPLLVLGGPVRIVGDSDAPVVVLRGSLSMSGSAHDDLIAVGGDIHLEAGSQARGNVVSLGGSVSRDDSASVTGSMIGSGSPLPSPSARAGLLGLLLVRLRLAGLAMTALLLLGLGVWAVLPWPAIVTTATARRFRLRSALLGIGTLLCAPLIVAPLAVSLAGLPLAVLLTLGLGGLWLIGIVSSAVRLGHRLLALGGRPHSLLSATLVGLICLGLLPALPVLGTVALLLAGCVGLGAALVAVWDRDVAGELAATAALSGLPIPE
jgi:hypothetical protein